MTIAPNRLADLERQAAARRSAVNDDTAGHARADHIVEFASDDRFLGKTLFPRQASLLKAMTVDTEHMTAYDHAVYEEWSEGFVIDADDDHPQWRGTKGTPGDLLDRVAWCRSEGRRWFRETLLLIGRRGSKGFIASIFGAWQLYLLLTDGDPHERHGVDPTKRISIVVFAGNKSQAVRNVFRDLKGTLLDSAWFKPYIARATVDAVYLFTPRQLRDGVDTSNHDLALIEIRASETTDLGQRGPAVTTIFMDEFAHLQGAGATANSTDIYEAATPATAQFGTDAAVVQTTSPWDKKGQAWKTYNRACDLDADAGTAKNPDFLMVQLESDALYLDAERGDTIPMWPGGPTFAADLKPIFVFDAARLRDEEANPDAFAVEYRAQWRSSLDAYLAARFVDRLWAPYRGARLTMTSKGRLGTDYYAHADPSLSQANFGFAICHLEYDDDDIPHVVYDVIHHWRPADFPDGIVSYIEIGDEIFDYICAFGISTVTFDHWNSAEIIERLDRRVTAARLPKRCSIYERRPDHDLNLDVWELFKTALGHNIVHAPYYEQADLELRAVEFVNGRVQIPDSGDVRTRDVADAMVFAFYNALGDRARDVFARLSGLAPRPVQGHAPPRALPPPRKEPSKPESHQMLADLGRSHQHMHAARRGPGSYNPARGGMQPRGGRGWWSNRY